MSTAHSSPEDSDRKYESPRMERLGSLTEMTQANRHSHVGDGAIFQISPTSTVLLTTSH
jgi:hypothetical protein